MNRRLLLIILLSLLVSLLLAWIFWPGEDEGIDPASAVEEGLRPALAGQVLDHAGRPIRNAEVLVGELKALSDEKGFFAFSELPRGTHQVDARANGYTRHDPGRITLEYADEPIEDLRLTLQRKAQITGRVLADTRPVADAQISISYVFAQGLDARQLDPFTASSVVNSQRDGRFTLQDLPPGRLHLLIESPNHPFFESREIYLRPGQQLGNLRFDIAAPPEEIAAPPEGLPDALFGQVRLTNGEPVPTAQVAFTDSRGSVVHRTRTDDQGFFEWLDGPEDPLYVRAYSPNHDPSPIYPIRPGEETLLEMIPGGMIQGIVIDQARRPIQNFHVSVAFAEFAQDTQHSVLQLPNRQVEVPTGRFEIGPFPSGRFRLVVQAEGYAPTTTEPFTVLPERNTGPISVILSRGGALEGTVLDLETGEPIAGARIQHSTRLSNGAFLQANTDGEGNFRLEEVPPGAQSFMVAHRDYIAHSFSNIQIPEEGAASYEFTLEPVGDGPRGTTFAGIGASLGRSDGGVEVTGLTDDSAAARAGVREGDRITAVDGRSIQDMTIDQVIEEIRGEEGVPVQLDVVRPGGGARRFQIHRERVFIAQPQRRGIR